MPLKPIVIATSTNQAAGAESIWNKLQNPEVFISKIITTEVNAENSNELNKLISGIPTPFARAEMFKYAIKYIGNNTDNLTGLLSFYNTIKDEWKGLIACIALDNQPITIEKIKLDYSDGKGKKDTKNIYEPKGALGNMLFENKDLWCDQLEVGHEETRKNAKPFIYVIRYSGIVIGATSPESLLFTAPVYEIPIENKGFYSQGTKKFIDPLKGIISEEEVEKLYVYVNHINNSLDSYRNLFTKRSPDTQQISVFLNKWLKEIQTYANFHGYKLDTNAIVPNFNKFESPFDKLFNFKTTLYGYRGRISSDLLSLQLPEGIEGIEVELGELLLDPDTCTVSEIIFSKKENPANAGVHMLKAISEPNDLYFTLPLSEKGLAIFQDEIEGLLQIGGNIRSELSAIYEMSSKVLKVTLRIDVNGNTTSFTKNYKNPEPIQGQKIICWPDFISKIWDKYYLYSELPHNSIDIQAFPLRADKNNFQLKAEIKDGKYQFKKIAANGNKIDINDTSEIIIEFDVNKLGSTFLKYEIYESSEPFKGIEFQCKNKHSGYLVFKSLTSTNINVLKDFRNIKLNPNPVRVGFDFGSNNICISYAQLGGQPELISFKNRRKFLLGIDVGLNPKQAALPDEVFFFQNEETQSNHIKSMVMIHDEKRVKNILLDEVVNLSKEIKGGFPVFEKNIPVEDSDETTHIISFDNQLSSIKYNMKWSSIKKENAYKQSLLKSLWLCTYAELFINDKYPDSLVWAYPASMNPQIIDQYRIMWGEIGKLNPLVNIENARVAIPNNWKNNSSSDNWGDNDDDNWGDDDGTEKNGSIDDLLNAQTEAESVCRHALGVGLTPGPRGLLMGFDIGGSTSDILCVALRKDSQGKMVNTLIKQSSIKFAAGKLSEATRKSKKFKNVLTSFCRRKEFDIHGITIPPLRLNESTSSFYYNMIIDRLTLKEDLDELYRNIAADCPDLFIINSYMTGLIMFYAGQLAYKIRLSSKDDSGNYKPEFFDEIRLGVFGKGGRMFDWLKAINEPSALGYYKECFGLGYGIEVRDHIDKFKFKYTDSENVKAEVSFGLSRRDPLNTTGSKIKELLGEEGYTYNGVIIDSFDDVQTKFLRDFGTELSYPKEFKRFTEFMKKFYSFSKERYGFSFPNFEQEINDMPIVSYVNNIPEYILARDGEDFDFEAPLIILEGMCFLDEVLFKQVFK